MNNVSDLVIVKKEGGRYVYADAYTEYGVRMHDDFLSSLFAPRPIKERIVNESRMQHGKSVVFNDTRYASRDVTLNFTISENQKGTYQENKDKFVSLLERPELLMIQVPSRTMDIFKLQYLDSTSYAENYQGTFGSMAIKFCEVNPNDRTITDEDKPIIS